MFQVQFRQTIQRAGRKPLVRWQDDPHPAFDTLDEAVAHARKVHGEDQWGVEDRDFDAAQPGRE